MKCLEVIDDDDDDDDVNDKKITSGQKKFDDRPHRKN